GLGVRSPHDQTSDLLFAKHRPDETALRPDFRTESRALRFHNSGDDPFARPELENVADFQTLFFLILPEDPGDPLADHRLNRCFRRRAAGKSDILYAGF